MKDTYKVKVYNTITKKVESTEVSKEIYEVYMRTLWNIADNNKSFYGHEIQMSGLIGGNDNAIENFHEFLDTEHTPEKQVIKKEQKVKALKALDKLSSKSKERFVQHYYYGISSKKIAEQNGTNEDTINKKFVRAKEKLKKYFNLPHDTHCMHEFVLCGEDKKEKGVSTLLIAKKLMDMGYHPPTVYFPLIVHEALMIEPTESETKETLDKFIDAMIQISKEIDTNAESFADLPYNTPVKRVDETQAARHLDVKEQ